MSESLRPATSPSEPRTAWRDPTPAITRARRAIVNRVVIWACWASAGIVMVPLALILWHLVEKGRQALTWDFFVSMPKPVGEAGGGMANAIVGTLIVVGCAALIAVPIGIAAGVYLAEHGRGKLASSIRYITDVL